ncbi:dihydrofolate reductase family protein [Pseudomonas sp. F1_0610]|uniref:dihydrofolate reductase family protein n=1 Tax=Pseudomonas sp. F1_0610 TaxID=3114284 RepID=UPI0039C20328
MTNIVYIATSIDGFIADENGNIDWLNCVENPGQSDYGFADFMSSIDAVVMGRTTFETVMGFGGIWPYDKPVFVLSTQLTSLPLGLPDNVQLLKGSPGFISQYLMELGYQRLYIDGGNTVQNFLAENLIDELIITRIPIVLGKGKPLFFNNENKIIFKHISTSVYFDTLVKSHYKRESGGSLC